MNASSFLAHSQQTIRTSTAHLRRAGGRGRASLADSLEEAIRQHQRVSGSQIRLYAVPEIEHARGRFHVSRRRDFRALLLVVGSDDRFSGQDGDLDKVDCELAVEVTTEEALRIARGQASTPDALRPSGFAWPTA